MKRNRIGFTSAEMIVAIGVGTLLVAGITMTFVAQRKALWRVKIANEMQQSLRIVSDMVVRDIQNAGYGMPMEDKSFSNWVTWVAGTTGRVSVVDGASAGNPDTVTMVGAFGKPVSSLSSAAASGATAVTIPNADVGEFDVTARKLIFIGRLELARIEQIVGNTLKISKSPSAGGVGLAYDHPAGTPIERVMAVTYVCRTNFAGFPHRPYLVRDENTGVLTNDLQKMVAIGIDNIQILRTNRAWNVTLRARASETDREYTHPVEGDRYRRAELTVTAAPRN